MLHPVVNTVTGMVTGLELWFPTFEQAVEASSDREPGLAANGADSEHRGGAGNALLTESHQRNRLGSVVLAGVKFDETKGVNTCLYRAGIPIRLIRADSGTSTAKRGPRSTRRLARRRQPLASPKNRLWERD